MRILSCASAFLFSLAPIQALQLPWQYLNDKAHDAIPRTMRDKEPPDLDRFSLRAIHVRGLGDKHRLHRKLSRGFSTQALRDDSFASAYTIPLGKSQVATVDQLQVHSQAALDDYHAQKQLGITKHPFKRHKIRLPAIHDRETILNLAKMTNDCYTAVPETDDWIDLDDGFNSTYHFGWDDDGLRGHVFTNEDNSTIILAYKGTSLVGGTQFKDKRNDNLLFSCCCGRVSYLWRPVCDCYEDTYTCNAACLENELRSRKHYYRAALDVYHNVKRDFPKGDIWIVGHSLGGAVASLVAQTYGLPAVTFQAPGEKLSARRLGLPIVPGAGFPWQGEDSRPAGNHSDAGFAKHIWAFGHTADPLFMGTCGGITSACWTAGFAMETHCHSGYECVYDTVEDLGWRQGISTHRIRNVIEDVILRYNSTPTPVRTDECVDCFNWNVSG